MESFQISGDPNHQKILLCSYVESCHPKDQNQDALLGLQMDQFSKENHSHLINPILVSHLHKLDDLVPQDSHEQHLLGNKKIYLAGR